MNKRLFEGIIVKPSGGRTGIPLPIPDVPGAYIRKSPSPTKNVRFSTASGIIKATDSTPVIKSQIEHRAQFKIDVSEHLRLHGAKPPFNISMISVREVAISDLASGWSQDNQFVTMDENGIITYEPIGTFVRNTLLIGVEVSDADTPPTPAGGCARSSLPRRRRCRRYGAFRWHPSW